MSSLPKDELSLTNDVRHKLFVTAIEKVTKQLESATEWHDFIPNLKKMKKIIESNAEFRSLPKRLSVMKQLSRCLHPALPHGVHLETLSVYETIFQILDQRQFQRDLLLYSYGLFPLLSSAAYPVKSVLLNLYETFFLPLGTALQPILTGFLIGLFSSLEEDVENSQRLNILLENLIHQSDEFSFYTSLWSAMSLVVGVRHSASLFLLQHFDRQQSRTEQKFLKGSDENVMIGAICTCFNSTGQSLAQRTLLDFLAAFSPMDEKQFDSIQMKQILHSTLHLFLQRDASLNRRIYNWFLGRDGDPKYFASHTEELLVETFVDALELLSICQIESSSHSEDERTNTKCQSVSATWTLTKLIQVLLVLIDKADVGPTLIEALFHHYLFVVYEQVYFSIGELEPTEIQQEKSAIETMKTFHLLLETLEPVFIWEYLTKMFASNVAAIEQICGVISMLLDIFNFDSDDEITTKILPEMMKNLLEIIETNLREFTPKRLALALEILAKISEKIRWEKRRSTFDDEVEELLDEMLDKLDDASLLRRFERFFHRIIQTFLLDEGEETFRRFQSTLEKFDLKFRVRASDFLPTFDSSCRLFERLEIETRGRASSSNDELIIDFALLSIGRNGSFGLRTRALLVLLGHWRNPSVDFLLRRQEFVEFLLDELWRHFDETFSVDEHRQTAQVLARLHAVLPDDRCDRLVARRLTKIDEFRRFFKLWNFTSETKSWENSLLVVLNVLQTSDRYRLKSLVQQWISHCFTHNSPSFLGQIDEIFRIFSRSTVARREQLVGPKRLGEENDELIVPRTSGEDYDDEYMRDYQVETELRRGSLSKENVPEPLVQVPLPQFVYTASIDFPRVLVGLNIVENLLDLLSSQLIQRLFVEREKENSYLFVLFEFLLDFLRSFPEEENETNVEVQFRSFSLLTRLCHELVLLARNGVLPVEQIHQLLRKVGLQKILLHLFNGVFRERTPFIGEFLRLLAQTICLEHLICSNDADLFYQALVNQTMFLSSILQYLQNLRFIEHHHFLFDFLIEILPFAGSTLKSLLVGTIEQLYRNLYYLGHVDFPIDVVDYIVCAISYLSYICHYALGTTTLPAVPCVLHAVYPQQRLKASFDSTQFDVRQIVFRKLPSVLSSLFFLWKTISSWTRRDVQAIRQQISSMISSLLKSHGVSVLRALAYCWGGRKRQSNSTILVRDHQAEMHGLIDILINLNDFTINEMIGNMNELIRANDKRQEIYTIWCFQFLLAYCEKQTNFSFDCWAKLAAMFKECLGQSLSSTVNFLMVRIWSLYIKQAISLIEKRDIKDVQEITMKLLENCNTIIGSVFDQGTWLRKSRPFLSSVDEPMNAENFSVSLSALSVLGEHATTLLDIVHQTSEEKEQVVLDFVQRFVKNLLPFVRLRTQSNLLAHRSASILLENLSASSYARDAWEKKLFELFFDANFFQTDLQALKAWRNLLGNFVADDKSSLFKDAMERIHRVQTSFFSSKENQTECALTMKRCAFLLFVAEKDQAARFLPEILKRLVELLKLPQTPILHTQIFLLFRTLAVRLSNKHFAAFWPLILTELVQIFLQLEQELLLDLHKETTSDVQRLTTSELSPPTMKLYLFACKLLEILLALPPAELFYFQFCREAFAGNHSVSFAQRLASLLNEKVQSSSSPSLGSNVSRPRLRQATISDIAELYPFFHRLSTLNPSPDENSFAEKFDQAKESTILEDFLEPCL